MDEPDVVKAAGGRIFAVAGGQLHAIDAAGPGLLGSLPLDGYGHELLLHGKRLLVMSQDGANGVGIEPGLSQPFRSDPVTLLTEIDASDPAKLTVVRVQRVRGLLVSARLTGAIARVVVTSTPRATGQPELRSRLRGWLAHTTVANRLTGQQADTPRHALRRRAPGAGLLRPRHAHRAHDRHGQGPARGGLRRRDDGRGDRVRVAATGCTWPRSAGLSESVPDAEPARRERPIHEFDASDSGETTYRASGRVPGFLLNQWAMSERGGVLRVASTEAPPWLGGGGTRVRAS